MTLAHLRQMFLDQGCIRLYAKTLAANDNSKNQLYLGSSFDVLNILPFGDLNAAPGKAVLKALLEYYWLSDAGVASRAPGTQLILYPQYPEVRMSGFLRGCADAPTQLMTGRLTGRVLFLGVDNAKRVLAYVAGPENDIAREFQSHTWEERYGVFTIIPTAEEFSAASAKQQLTAAIRTVHGKGWINGKRLSSAGVIPYSAQNAGGYTLEAELGIAPNGRSMPDHLGWEIKQYKVRQFGRIPSVPVTLMTPEPTGGLYKEDSMAFMRRYGHPNRKGIPDRLDFTGAHVCNVRNAKTGLTLLLRGFNAADGKITDTAGAIVLVSDDGTVAAEWSFTLLIEHWGRKHAFACYVPVITEKMPDGSMRFMFGNLIMLCEGTSFELFLQQMHAGIVYYDPGINMKNVSTRPDMKKRSQFRTKSKNITHFYERSEIVDTLLLP